MQIEEFKVDDIVVWDVTGDEPKYLASRFVGLELSNIMRFRLKLKLFYLYPDKDYIENFQKLLYHTTAIELHYGYAVRFDRYDPAACFLKMNACRLAECIDKDGVLHAIFKGLWFYPPFRDVGES